jgi:hypothetical protein
MSQSTLRPSDWIAATLALYAAAFAMRVMSGGEWAEPLAILVLFGLLFPLLALLLALGSPYPTPPSPARAGEGAVLALILVYVCLFLAAKGRLESWLLPVVGGSQVRELAKLLIKLVALGAAPLLLYRWWMGVWPQVSIRQASGVRLGWMGLLLGACVFTVSLMLSSDTTAD